MVEDTAGVQEGTTTAQTDEASKEKEPVQELTGQAEEGAGKEGGEPSAPEDLDKLIREKVSEAITQETEKSKREIQSVKDKSRREVETAVRRARTAETALGATEKYLKDADPDLAKELELARLRAEKEGTKSLILPQLCRMTCQPWA